MPDYDAFSPGYQEEQVNFDDSFKDESEVTSPEYAAEGIYHVAVGTVDASGKNFPGAVFLTFEILAGNVEGQEGKNLRFPVWPPSPEAKNVEAAKKRWQKTVLQLMLALGLRRRGEFGKVSFTEAWWNALEGKQCMVRVTHTERTRTSDAGTKVNWIEAAVKSRDDLFPIGDEAVAGVSIDEEAAQLGGYLSPPSDGI